MGHLLIEGSGTTVSVVDLPGCTVHHRIIESDTSDGAERLIRDFEEQIRDTGATIYSQTRWNIAGTAYLVIWFHKTLEEVDIPQTPRHTRTTAEMIAEAEFQEDLYDLGRQYEAWYGGGQ